MNFKIQGVTRFVTVQQALWQQAGFSLFYVVRSYTSALPSSPAFTWSVSLWGTDVCAVPASGTHPGMGLVGMSAWTGESSPFREGREFFLWA